MRVTRKVNHDATLSVESILYETEQSLANSRLEVRYDPDWLANSNQPILLYRDGMKVGEARQVNFFDNARAKRKGRGRQSQSSQELLESVETSEQKATPSISYAQIDDQLKQSSREVGDR
ncbi:hypothetical protein Dred_3237 [Desulforamulus reducens MI-1]|uniref:Uncharacterized protein n=1 Tax=Desulforamulus reducens (strain ATCC BAA-1160 / DSM 100696 / MI-1) TaxID=349161 RepID=A4J9I6_DESRM|nr:Mu transposase C-terminal domain-containing protein [Desulforamulus reducens]ABO51739.1 hypothetical protein Dred_3237 [Desulforamulus reducens MI-1]